MDTLTEVDKEVPFLAYSVNSGYAKNWVFRSQNTGQKSSGLETKWWEIGLTGADREVLPFFGIR